MSIPFDALLETAHKLADAASAITLQHFRNNFVADHKGGSLFDPVTAADRGAESAMRDVLAREFPGHGIVGEEFGSVNEGADYVWTLDPIDGTRAFILGLPLWGTLIGLQHEGKPVLGIMDQPFIGERFWNDSGAAWYRGPKGIVRCNTRPCGDLSRALLTATSPDMFEGESEARFNALAQAVRMRRFGGDCYAYCMLALGHIDIVAEAQLKPFDIVPLIPIVEKAGGVVTDWDGGDASSGGRCLACGDPSLQSAALSLLKI
ncbi:MAG: histidinol-phosphatase [Rhodomicrobium sp.]|nr:histidinol-phosphatase [Rhodomicrobium sp.]